MPIYNFTPSGLVELARTSFAEQKITERRDLQALIRDQIEIISPATLVIAEEFSEWAGSNRRIDLLGLGRDGSLVVIELKRTDTGEHMELQALRYAAMVSTITFRKAVEVYANYNQRRGLQKDAEHEILAHLGWDEPREAEFAQDVRIVLASADFSQELTTTVMWLNERDLDIRCVRLIPYIFDGKVLLDVQQVIPLPEAEAYQIKVREQSEERREAQRGEERHKLREQFWSELLSKAKARTALHAGLSPGRDTWIAAGAGRTGLSFVYRVRKHDCEVAFAIERRSAEENRAIFMQLHAAREAIESQYGSSLEWDQEDDRGSYHIRDVSTVGGYRDTDNSEAIYMWMIDHMISLEGALRPYLEKLA
jgi:hypothetical protein